MRSILLFARELVGLILLVLCLAARSFEYSFRYIAESIKQLAEWIGRE